MVMEVRHLSCTPMDLDDLGFVCDLTMTRGPDYVTSLTQAALSGTLAETLRSLREARHNWKGLDQLDNHMLSVSEHVYI